jgi:hypothetical protein
VLRGSQTHAQDRLQTRGGRLGRVVGVDRDNRANVIDRRTASVDCRAPRHSGEASRSIRPIDFILGVDLQLFAVSRFPVTQVRLPEYVRRLQRPLDTFTYCEVLFRGAYRHA